MVASSGNSGDCNFPLHTPPFSMAIEIEFVSFYSDATNMHNAPFVSWRHLTQTYSIYCTTGLSLHRYLHLMKRWERRQKKLRQLKKPGQSAGHLSDDETIVSAAWCLMSFLSWRTTDGQSASSLPSSPSVVIFRGFVSESVRFMSLSRINHSMEMTKKVFLAAGFIVWVCENAASAFKRK